jgi:hypothetical protein
VSISAATVALALWGAQSLTSTIAVAVYRWDLKPPAVPGVEPRVAVILAVRGGDAIERHLALLRAQSYPRYRIIACVESGDDPAFAKLKAAAAAPGPPVEVAVAGLAENAGQKVWNLLAALGRLTSDDEIVAFIDADTLPTPFWLPDLIAVLVNSRGPVATGYRWMTPADDRWSSACLAAANNAIAALPRDALHLTIVWGGSVAIWRLMFEAIQVADYWRGAISDDLQMAKAVRDAGLVARAPRQGLLLSPVACSWPGLVAFGVRQYRLVYLHRPWSWAVALACLWAPLVFLALAAPTLVGVAPVAWTAIAALVVLGEIRAGLRRSVERVLWAELDGSRTARRRAIERLTRPLSHVLHALSAAAAPLSREIRWAGVRYRIDGPQAVTVERREAPGRSPGFRARARSS